MKKCTGAVISWLIQQQAITEEDREIYTYAVDNMCFIDTFGYGVSNRGYLYIPYDREL